MSGTIKQIRLNIAVQMVTSDPPLFDLVLGEEKPDEKEKTKILRQLLKDNPSIKRVLEWYTDKRVCCH